MTEVERNEQGRFQRVTIGPDTGHFSNSAYNFDNLSGTDWEGVEIVAHMQYLSPRQVVIGSLGRSMSINHTAKRATFTFPITKLQNPAPYNTIPDGGQDLGGFGMFDLEDPLNITFSAPLTCNDPCPTCTPDPTTNPPTRCPYARRVLQVNDNDANGWRQTQVYLENHIQFLDYKNEWYFDPTERKVWVILPCQSNPASATTGVVVPIAKQLLILRETQYVTFDGIDFAYTHFPMPMMGLSSDVPGYATSQSSWQWMDNMPNSVTYNSLPGAVELAGASNCTFTNCRIGHTGASGVTLGTVPNPDSDSVNWVETNYNTFYRCEVFDLGGHGFYIGDHAALTDDWSGPASTNTQDPHEGNTIEESLIHRYGVIYKDAAGNFASHTRNLTIEHCGIEYGNWTAIALGTIQRHEWAGGTTPSCCGCPRSASLPGWPRTNEGVVIQNCDIFRPTLRLIDGGGIYMMGSHPDSSITGNYIHEVSHNPYLNYVSHVAGMFWDRGGDQFTLEDNFIEKCHEPFRFSTSAPVSATEPGWGAYAAPTWPVDWNPSCDSSSTFLWEGQDWVTTNWWIDPTSGSAEAKQYKNIEGCLGHMGLTFTTYTTPPPTLTASVRVPRSFHNPPSTSVGAINTIVSGAGPTNRSTYFKYGTGTERIYPQGCGESAFEDDLWRW